MQGLDSLAMRLKEYYALGARFTKWRSPLEVEQSSGRPTRLSIEANMRDLARFALISQAEGLVPIVEPDLIMKGTHTLAVAVAINTEIAGMLYHSLLEHGVYMEGCILKVNMVNPGMNCATSYTVEEAICIETFTHIQVSCLIRLFWQIATANLEVLQRTMPTAIQGVNFLSGGQSLEDATARLSAINRMKTKFHPWNISFSWSAAIQFPLLEICKKHKGILDSALPEMEDLYLKELEVCAAAAKGTHTWRENEGAHIPK